MNRIELTTAQGPLPADFAVPAGSGPWPGVVVVHDAVGATRDLRDNLQRFADNGYLGLAPHLYARGGIRCVVSTLMAVRRGSGQACDDLLAARDYLKARDDCTGAVGIAGFCMGGGFALVMGAKGFDASAPFYPSVSSNYDPMVEGSCPVVASLGSRDIMNIGSGPKLQAALDRRGIPNDVKTYPGVGHSFANDLPAQPILRIAGFGYDAAVTDDAYRRVFDFFGEHLGASAP